MTHMTKLTQGNILLKDNTKFHWGVLVLKKIYLSGFLGFSEYGCHKFFSQSDNKLRMDRAYRVSKHIYGL